VRTGDGARLNDIVWLHPDGHAMEDDAWERGGQAIGMYLNGNGIAGKDARGGTLTDDHFLLYFNGGDEVEVTLPADEYATQWDVVVDTGGNADESPVIDAGSSLKMAMHSVVVLQEHAAPEADPDHSVAASVAALSEGGTVASSGTTAGRRRG
jgi:isoamylase